MPEENNLPEWLPERLERARKAAIKELLAELGFEDAETLKQVLETGSQAQEALQQITEEKTQLGQRVLDLENTQQQLRIEMAFQQAVAAYDFIEVADARTLADLSGVQIDEQGNVTGMQEAVEQLVESRPHLLRRPYLPSMEAYLGREMPSHEEKKFTTEEVESIKRRFRMLW